MSKKKFTLVGIMILIVLYTSPFGANNAFANSNKATDPQSQAKAEQFISQPQALGFQENKGQMTDMDGKPAPYVLFKAEAPNLNIWITDKGITYQFFKMEEEHEEVTANKQLAIGTKETEEKITGEWHRVDMTLKGASIKKENILTENDITQGQINYYLGHCPDGVFNVKTHTKVTIKNVYQGVDWVLYTAASADGGGLKHDFIVHPHADPNQIKLIYEGSGKINISNNEIHFENELGQVTEGKLLCYQGSESTPVNSYYTLKENPSLLYSGAGNNSVQKKSPSPLGKDGMGLFSYEVSPSIPNYNHDQPLIIDPTLVWGTYHASTGLDGVASITTVNTNGDVFITGYITWTNFPTMNAGTYFQPSNGGGRDVFIVKFNNSGVRQWATYYGGSTDDIGIAIASNSAGAIYITGGTSSVNFPVCTPCLGYFDGTMGGSDDAFLLKFDNTGTRLWATYYGGSADERGHSITVDNSDNVFVTGYTNSIDFPTLGAYQPANAGGAGDNDVFISKFSSAGAQMVSTYYGGNNYDIGNSIATNLAGNVFVTGTTLSTNFPLINPLGGAFYQSTQRGVFIVELSNALVPVWSTHSDGSYSGDIAIDPLGNIFVVGHISGAPSASFPFVNPIGSYFQTTPGGGFDLFILKFNSSRAPQWGTLFGDFVNETISGPYWGGYGMDIDASGNVFITGTSASFVSNLPLLDPGCGSFYYGTGPGPFLLEFNNDGNLLWSTFLGINGFDASLALDANNCLFVVGEHYDAAGTGIWTRNPGGGAYSQGKVSDHDSYIIKFCPTLPVLAATASSTNLLCNDTIPPCAGTATAYPTGCALPYQYSWSTSPVQTTKTATGLCAGTYTVTVTDAILATVTATVTITQPPPLTVNVAVSCSGNSATVTASGGTPIAVGAPYTYSWIPTGQTTQTATGLLVGTTYTVVVRDANLCPKTQTFVVSSSGLSVSTSSTNAGCTINNGTATINPNGVGPYTYNWVTSPVQTTQTATGLAAGTYSVTVTDVTAGCAKDTTVTVLSNNSLTVTTSFLPTGCATSIGTATVTPSGGTPNYTYLWNPTGQTTQTATGLACTTYSVTVTDVNGCTRDTVVTVTCSNPVTLSTTTPPPTPATCTAFNGDATVIATGSSGYIYSWVPGGQTTPTATGLDSGNYVVTVTDGGGCSRTATVTVPSNNPLTVATSSTQTSCTACTGTAIATPSGGSGYTYLWSFNAGGQTTPTANTLCTGTYSVTVTDANGCTRMQTASVTQQLPSATATATLYSIPPDGSTQLTATGGGTYQWSPSAGLNCDTCANPIATPTITTTYTVTVTGTNGCTKAAFITINVELPCGEIFIPNAFSPNQDGTNELECVMGGAACFEKIHFAIYDRWGQKVFHTTNPDDVCWDGKFKGNLMNTAVFVYYLRATLTSGEKIKKEGNITLIR